MQEQKKSRELTRSLTLRVPVELYREIERLSERERRSVNAQTVYLLYKIFANENIKPIGTNSPQKEGSGKTALEDQDPEILKVRQQH